MSDERMEAEAAAADDEWRAMPIGRVTRREETPTRDERCKVNARVRWDDRITYGTTPGVICQLKDGHEGDHFDGLDGVWWEVLA